MSKLNELGIVMRDLITRAMPVVMLSACAQFQLDIYPLPTQQVDVLRSTLGMRLQTHSPGQAAAIVLAENNHFLPVYGGAIDEPVTFRSPQFDKHNLIVELSHPSLRGAFKQVQYRYHFKNSGQGYELTSFYISKQFANTELFHNTKAVFTSIQNIGPSLYECAPSKLAFDCEAELAIHRSNLKKLPLIRFADMPFALDYSVQIDSPLL